ncbi:MAG: c-type cytochrome domain-containing protein [Pirellulaceae bacterium]
MKMFYVNRKHKSARVLFTYLTALLLCGLPIVGPSAFADEASELDFNRDLLPLLSKNCIACHNAKKAEGSLNLETHDALLAGGDSGDLLAVGKEPSESVLFGRMTSTDDPMPPDDNTVGAKRLTADEVELFKKWIAAGAPIPTAPMMKSLTWQPVPAALQPVYALTTSSDGNFLAYGRGSTVTIAELNAGVPNHGRVQDLIDSSLSQVLKSESPATTHLDIVQSIAISPDNNRLATGGFRTVKIWRRQTQPTRTLRGLANADTVSKIDASGRWIAQRAHETALEITDLHSGQSHRFLTSHTAEILALAWMVDSPHLLSGDAAGKLVVTHAENYQVAPVSLDSPLVMHAVERISDTQFLVVNADQQVLLLTLTIASDGTPTAAVQPQAALGTAADIAVAKNGQQAVVATAEGKIKLVGLPNFEVVKEIDAPAPFIQIELSGDAQLVAGIPATGPAHVWRASGELVAKLDQDYSKSQLVRYSARDAARQKLLVDKMSGQIPELKKASEQEVEAAKKVQETRDKAAEALAAKMKEVESSANGVSEAEKKVADAQAAVAAAMKQVEMMTAELEAKKKAAAEVEQQKVAAMAELAKREQALATANDSVARAAAKLPELEQKIANEKNQLVELEAKAAAAAAQTVATDQPLTLALSADATKVIVAHADGQIRVFSDTGLPLANQPSIGLAQRLHINEQNQLVSLTSDGVVQSWDLNFPWTLERTLGTYEDSPFSDRVTALDFSPDGQWLAVGSGPPSRFGDVKLVNVTSGEIAKDFGEAHSDTVLSIRFSPDGRQLATAGADKLCRIFDTSSGELRRNLEGHTHHILGVAWKDDGQTLVTASADASLKVWDVEAGTQLRTIAGLSKEVSAVDFVGQTSQFVLASTDGSVRLYNADNGQQVRAYGGANGALYAIGLSTDDQQVYSGGQAGHVWTWKLDDAKLLDTLP